MNKEQLSYFNLSSVPFTKEIEVNKLQKLPTIERALEALEMFIQIRGFGMLTGKSGSGKSCLLRLLIDSLHTGLYRVIYVCHTSVGLTEFYSHLCKSMGVEAGMRRSAMFRQLQERILSLNKSHKLHPVLLIDEAHRLSNEVLAELRLLANFEIDSYHGLTVLLCGQESLTMKLGISTLESLSNSISMNIGLENLKKEETESYIEKRLTDCGAVTPLFTKNALALIHQASAGVLRVINTIAAGAMFKAFTIKSSQVEIEHVQSVIAR
jgi:type II secretory pathway predicted ATPase ExeA